MRERPVQPDRDVRFDLTAGDVEHVRDVDLGVRRHAPDDSGHERSVPIVGLDGVAGSEPRVELSLHVLQPREIGGRALQQSGVGHVDPHPGSAVARADRRIRLPGAVHFLGLGGRAGSHRAPGRGQHVVRRRESGAELPLDAQEQIGHRAGVVVGDVDDAGQVEPDDVPNNPIDLDLRRGSRETSSLQDVQHSLRPLCPRLAGGLWARHAAEELFPGQELTFDVHVEDVTVIVGGVADRDLFVAELADDVVGLMGHPNRFIATPDVFGHCALPMDRSLPGSNRSRGSRARGVPERYRNRL